MHGEQREFLEAVARKHQAFHGMKVLELGSLNINGSARGVFNRACSWTGVDWREGPGVDEVSLAHEWDGDTDYDALVSGEMLEHDPHWVASIRNGLMHLKPGAVVVITCAGPVRKPHRHDCAPGGHYGNVESGELHEVLSELCESVLVEVGREGADVYAEAIRSHA